MKKILLNTLLLFVSIASATTWQKADLQYIQTINGKNYTAEVTLLKPESYFTAQHATNAGDKLNVDLSEMGLGTVTMDVVKLSPYKGIAIKDTNGKTSYQQVDEINWEGKTNRPAVATYKTWAQIVNTYSFIDSSTGEISKINTTPGHRFYVANKHDYIAIKDVTLDDTLINQHGQIVKLFCPNYRANHECGERYNTDAKPTPVYNFEVYQQHRYYVSEKEKNFILTHNPGCRKTIMTNYVDSKIGIISSPDGRIALQENNKTTITKNLFSNEYAPGSLTWETVDKNLATPILSHPYVGSTRGNITVSAWYDDKPIYFYSAGHGNIPKRIEDP